MPGIRASRRSRRSRRTTSAQLTKAWEFDTKMPGRKWQNTPVVIDNDDVHHAAERRRGRARARDRQGAVAIRNAGARAIGARRVVLAGRRRSERPAALRRRRQADRARSEDGQTDRELRRQRHRERASRPARLDAAAAAARDAVRRSGGRRRGGDAAVTEASGGGRRRWWRLRRQRLLVVVATRDLQEPRDSRRLVGRRRRSSALRRSAGVRCEDRKAACGASTRCRNRASRATTRGAPAGRIAAVRQSGD